MIDFRFEEKTKKVQKCETRKEGFKLIWGWIKSGTLSMKEADELIKLIKD